MFFEHSNAIWTAHPDLAATALYADGITAHADDVITDAITRFSAVAETRLASSSEGELPEIRAWRRTFSQMGLKPTQYRCASEALLRRFKKEGALPRIHPLIDLCNALSLAYAIPIAVFDASAITDHLRVRHATGDEEYLTFSGDVEHPYPDEVIFADGAGRAHARRWTNRQSGYSAVRETTTSALIVAEAMHETARADVENLAGDLEAELVAAWSVTPEAATLSAGSPRLTVLAPAPADASTSAHPDTR
ncbi:hypothetical protein EF847_14980 [Actinobacteria bacterium YIM 96077]|uniref:B3/B4 tRNA-binding domain-containing protein n=1 Tax=Phytoactinopolyspora halophila TaxID=1981511 RepID=A0A329QTA3_9ACTN|nr:phenylalanine--tRNA ligase beta subunit-related protein [Phytoactinopolyspora halophila]AYY13807.1 hypothetical protein EF847_14980 [Actinobacteria bacterium YIM 96077]RAW15650.1 hypothetical protein DPM12_08360 [Phytoactinopolyspora halophila]